MQNVSKRHAVPVPFAASAKVSASNKNLERPTPDLQQRRTTIKEAPSHSRLRREVYLERLISFLYERLEETLSFTKKSSKC